MEQLTPNEILHLSDSNCPDCNGDMSFNKLNELFSCTCCGKTYLYEFYKKCKIAYEKAPQEYLNHIEKSNLP